MATLREVKDLFKNLSEAKLSAKSQGFFKLKIRDQECKIADKDIDLYISFKDSFKNQPDTSIFFKSYYEHVVSIGSAVRFSRFLRDGEPIELENQAKNVSIKIGYMSTLFLLYLLNKTDLSPNIKRHIRPSPIFSRQKEEIEIGHLFRIRTAKVSTLPDVSFANNQKYLNMLCKSSLYNIAYCNGTSISLSESWERSDYWLGAKRSETAQFPLQIYNSELTAYYQLAIGSDSLILSYLALYKVIEFFFTSSSEKELHQHVKERLIQPDFHYAKPIKLRELVQTIRKYDQRMDERKMLVTVLQHYIDKDEIRSWITQFETEYGKYFTVDQTIFDQAFKIDTSDDQLCHTIANRIYHIRNALVHSKEGEISRFIPFAGQEKLLYKEVSILQYISEQLIIKTGKDVVPK